MFSVRRVGWAVEGGGLENRWGLIALLGFESLTLRQQKASSLCYLLFVIVKVYVRDSNKSVKKLCVAPHIFSGWPKYFAKHKFKFYFLLCKMQERALTLRQKQKSTIFRLFLVKKWCFLLFCVLCFTMVYPVLLLNFITKF